MTSSESELTDPEAAAASTQKPASTPETEPESPSEAQPEPESDAEPEADERGAGPTLGGVDELLENPPESDAYGAFAGYQSNKRVRWIVAGALGLGTIGAFWGGSWYVDYRRAQARRGITPTYEVSREIGPEERVMHWEEGAARLGLSREAPGVNLIVLPDQEIRLFEGHDSAQLSVRVEGGRTVKLKVLTGRIDVTPIERP